MCPSPSPDANDRRDQPWRPVSQGPRGPRRPKHPWITAVLVLFGLLVVFGGLGALLDGSQKGISGTTAPTETSASQPSENPDRASPAGTTKPPAEPPNKTATAPSTKPKPSSIAPTGAVVLRVVDGDTLEVRGDGGVLPRDTVARVRLLEIDTPERGACFADEATARTTTLR